MQKIYLLLFLALTGCVATDQSVLQYSPDKPIFDIPALVGKSIDQVQAILGPSQREDLEPTPAQVRLGATQWDHSFVRDTATLLVTYDAETRKVTDFFLMTNYGRTTDYTPLLRLGNVTSNERRLQIEPVALPTNGQVYTGVKFVVKPAQPTR